MASGDKVYIADKATLDEVKGKIGSTTDTGGSSTAGSVFGKLNYLVTQASTYLSSIYTYVTRIGGTNDAQSSSTTTGSIFAKLNYLVSQVSSYLFNIYNRLGTPTDSANDATSGNVHAKLNWFLNLFGKTNDTGGSSTAGTVMAKGNAILTEVNKIGNTNDTGATSISGTAMGKLNNLLEYKPRMNFVQASIQTANYTEQIYIRFIANNKLYCQTTQISGVSYIAIFDTNTLVRLVDIPNGTDVVSPFYVTDSRIYCYDKAVKRVIMYSDSTYQKLGESAVQSITATYNNLFVFGGRVYLSFAYSATTSKLVVFDAITLAQIGDVISLTKYPVDLFVADGIVYLGTQGGGIQLYNANTLAYVTSIDSDKERTNLFVSNGIIFATDYSSAGKKVYLYDASTRQKIGETAEQTDFCRDLIVEYDIIYFVTNNYVYCIDINTLKNRKEVFITTSSVPYVVVKDRMVYYSYFESQKYKVIKVLPQFQLSHYERGDLV